MAQRTTHACSRAHTTRQPRCRVPHTRPHLLWLLSVRHLARVCCTQGDVNLYSTYLRDVDRATAALAGPPAPTEMLRPGRGSSGLQVVTNNTNTIAALTRCD
eukprot:364126-Chlamydomonas_euryale.AAC.5